MQRPIKPHMQDSFLPTALFVARPSWEDYGNFCNIIINNMRDSNFLTFPGPAMHWSKEVSVFPGLREERGKTAPCSPNWNRSGTDD